jgi:hypothetical protein
MITIMITIIITKIFAIVITIMITITTTQIIKHPETSAAALSINQCLTGSVTLFHNCIPTPPV